LIGLLAFGVQKSWPKKQQINGSKVRAKLPKFGQNNIVGQFLPKFSFLAITFEPETSKSQSKAQKTHILVWFSLKI